MPDPEDAFDTRLSPAEIDPSRPEPIETPWGSFAIFSLGSRLVAVQSFCPHMQGPLFQGTLAGESLTCPWHEWRFSLATGKRLDPEGHELGGSTLEFLETSVGPSGTILLSRPRNQKAPVNP
jgi:nitrite reductase/ring-hydroxylating ferredoxin subunit